MQHLAARDLEDRRLDGQLLQRLAQRGGVGGVVIGEGRVEEAGGAVDHAVDREGARRHLPQLVPDRAEARDRHPELVALGGVAHRLADREVGAPGGGHRELEAPVVQGVERDLVPLADLAEHVPGRHADVLQDDRRGRRAVQAHLVLFLAGRHARPGPFHQERGELLAVDLGEDDVEVREAAVGDPHLLAGQREAAVGVPGRPGLGPERVRPRARLAEAVGADPLAADEPAEVRLLLGGGAEAVQGQDGEAGVGPERRPERPAVADAGADDDGRRLVEGEAAPGLGHVGPQQPEVAGAADEAPGELPVLGLEPVVVGRDLVVDELGRGLVDQPVLVAQPLGGERRAGRGLLQQPRAAGDAGCGARECRHRNPPGGLAPARTTSYAARSKMPAAPMPPPTHMVTRP